MRPALFGLLVPLVHAACVGGGPAMDRDAAMAKTFAGQNTCQEKTDDKPFIIEWDATDMAAFETRAQRDMVFVRYEGCELEVIDACADDDVPGRFGAYRPPSETSGSVEKVVIEDQSDLFAKLPLGVATFGGDVARGVKLEMEYYVSGVALATRTSMSRGALRDNPQCAKATHFVYAYNLGAFAIDSLETASEEITAEVKDVGGGLKSDRKRKTEKRAGVLDACGSDKAIDKERCRVPIRLALRPIDPGEGEGEGEVDDAPGPVEPGKTETRLTMAESLRQSAMEKAMAGDGGGCLEELRKADELDPHPRRNANSGFGQLGLRAQCEMMTGDCESGIQHKIDADLDVAPNMPPTIAEEGARKMAKKWCLDMRTPWDELDFATSDVKVAWLGKKWEACASHAPRLRAALAGVEKAKPPAGETMLQKIEREGTMKGGTSALLDVAECLARIGQCAEGKATMKEGLVKRRQTRSTKEPGFTEAWEKRFPACRGK